MLSAKPFIYRALQLIPKGRRQKGIVNILLLTVTSILDLFSLASFLPLLIFIISPEKLLNNRFLAKLQLPVDNTDYKSVGVLLILFIIVFFIAKTRFTLWVNQQKAKFAYEVSQTIASRMYRAYLDGSYQNFISTDFTNEMNRITNLPLIYANNIIIPAGTILAESIILFCVMIGILFYDPLLVISIGTLVVPVALIYYLQKRSIKKSSESIKIKYPLLLKYTLQGIESFAEIKIFQKENFFQKRFENTFTDVGGTMARDHSRHMGMSRITEVVMAIVLGVMFVYALFFIDSKEESILFLGLFAAGSLRVIPSVNRIFAGFIQIKTHEYVVGELENVNSEKKSDEQDEEVSFTRSIRLSSITFSHADGTKILDNLNLTINKGEKLIITGKSGGGKTTVLLILMRFLKERSGLILIDDAELREKHHNSLRNLIGYVPQNPVILDTTIMENIAFGIPPALIDENKVKSIINDLDLEEWVNSLSLKLWTLIGEKGSKISGGQRQRLAIARAMYHDKELFLLDEITNQLDERSEAEVLKAVLKLSDQGKTIIMVSHNSRHFNYFDNAYDLKGANLEKIMLHAQN